MNLRKESQWLRANCAASSEALGVDSEKEVIRGYILAEEGSFKSEGRGEFDQAAIRSIVRLAKAEPKGLKSRFTHPNLSSDGLGKFLGRAKNVRSDKVMRANGEGAFVERLVARGDLHIAASSHDTPSGDLGGYILRLASEDPGALQSSLVLTIDEEHRREKDGSLSKDEEGSPLPPLWRPTALHASDIVDEGDAVKSFLTGDVDALPDAVVRQASELLDAQFGDAPREVVEERCLAYFRKYLATRYETDEGDFVPADQAVVAFRHRLRKHLQRLQ